MSELLQIEKSHRVIEPFRMEIATVIIFHCLTIETG